MEGVPGSSGNSAHLHRRLVSKREFHFIDDEGQVLGSLRSSPALLNGTTTTAAGSYRSTGTRFNHRMVHIGTGAVVLGGRVGWRLPNGEPLTSKFRWSIGTQSRAERVSARLWTYRHEERRFDLMHESGTVAIRLRWVNTRGARRWYARGTAEFARGLAPTVDLVPLVSFAFQRFQIKMPQGP
jgi:hypothetical protein